MDRAKPTRAVAAVDAVDAVDPAPEVTAPRRDDGQERRRERQQAYWQANWAKALDDLELDVARAEELLAEERRSKETPFAGGWTPPQDLGPLPLDLKPRADAILQRQLAVAKQISTALGSNRRQAAATAKIETGSSTSAPRAAYLDYSM